MAKKEKTAFEKKAYSAFASMAIDEWLDFIKANAKDEKEVRAYKVIARRSLNIDNMKAYIEAHDNTKKAKADFKAATWGVKYLKDPDTKKFILSPKGEKLIAVDDKTGEPIMVQSIVYAIEYFINQYIPELKLEELPATSKAFDAIADW
jgi:hypothetical protein